MVKHCQDPGEGRPSPSAVHSLLHHPGVEHSSCFSPFSCLCYIPLKSESEKPSDFILVQIQPAGMQLWPSFLRLITDNFCHCNALTLPWFTGVSWGRASLGVTLYL